MKCIRVCLVQLLIICLSPNTVSCGFVSPCPQVFKYLFDGVEWYGVVSVPSPPFGSTITLNVQMSIPSALPTGNAGSIELVGPRADILEAALYGRNINYNIRFPLPSVIPVITGIILNGNTLCSGPPASGLTVTAVTLQHILTPANRTPNTNNAALSTARPNVFEYDPESKDTGVQIFDEYGNEIKFNSNNNQPYPSNGEQHQPYPVKRPDSLNNQQNTWSVPNQPSNNLWNTQNKPHEVIGQPLNPNEYTGQETYPQSKPNQIYNQQYQPNTFHSNQNNKLVQYLPNRNTNAHNIPTSHNYNNQLQNPQIRDSTSFVSPNNNHNSAPATLTQFTELRPNNQNINNNPVQVLANQNSNVHYIPNNHQLQNPQIRDSTSFVPSNNNQNSASATLNQFTKPRPNNQNINNNHVQVLANQNSDAYNIPNNHQLQLQNPQIGNSTSFVPPNNQNQASATLNQLPRPNNQVLTQGVTSQSLKPPNINPQPSPVKPEPSFHALQQNYLKMCGLTVISNPLIANGQATKKGEFPWLSALFTQKTLGLEFRCSASLISNKHVVTAGHCVKFGDNPAVKPSEILIILGKHNIRRWTEKDAVISEVERIHIHPEYGSLGFNNDLAVLSLTKIVEFTLFIRPVCMWSETEDLREIVGQLATVVGWGRDEQGHQVTDEPGLAMIPIVSQEDCLRSKVEFNYYTSNRTLCAGLRNGSGPCNGDSGGPLLLHRKDRWVLRGVVSLSLVDPKTRNCDVSQYTVFTDVAKYKEWLLQFFTY